MDEIFKTLEIIECNMENSKSKVFTNLINQETLKKDAIFLKVIMALSISILLKIILKIGFDKQIIRQ